MDNDWTTIGQDTQKIPCPIAENHIEQTIGQPLDNIHRQSGGGGVVQTIGQEINITITDSVTTAEYCPKYKIKVGDKVLVPHLQASDQGEIVREVGEGWVMVDYFPHKFPLDEIIRL